MIISIKHIKISLSNYILGLVIEYYTPSRAGSNNFWGIITSITSITHIVNFLILYAHKIQGKRDKKNSRNIKKYNIITHAREKDITHISTTLTSNLLSMSNTQAVVHIYGWISYLLREPVPVPRSWYKYNSGNSTSQKITNISMHVG